MFSFFFTYLLLAIPLVRMRASFVIIFFSFLAIIPFDKKFFSFFGIFGIVIENEPRTKSSANNNGSGSSIKSIVYRDRRYIVALYHRTKGSLRIQE